MPSREDLLAYEEGGGDQWQKRKRRHQREDRGEAHRGARVVDARRGPVQAGAAGEAGHVRGQARVAARLAGGHGEAAAQAVEELLPRAGAGDDRERPRHGRERVRVAPAHAPAARGAGGPVGAGVHRRRHHAVARLHQLQAGERAVEVGRLTPARERGEEMVHRRGDALLGEVCEERLRVGAQSCDPLVLSLADPEDAHVQRPPSGQHAGHFLADEHAGKRRDLERAGDGVVVGKRDQVHAAAARFGVHGAGLRIGLLGDGAQPSVGRPGVTGVDVQVAAH
jgi:hypothetical protein